MFSIKQADNKFPTGMNGDDDSGNISTVNGEFETIKVSKNATFTVTDETNNTSEDITFANHESRIKALETNSGNSNNGASSDTSNLFTLTEGYPEIILSTSNVSQTNNGNKHTLTITIDNNAYDKYVGDMVEFVLPDSFHLSEQVKITRQANGKYTCPAITYKSADGIYTLTNESEQTTLYISIDSLFDNPMSLFTNGDMQIRSLVKQPIIQTNNVVKCNAIESDNSFKLYKSPLPNLYDMREYGSTANYWWGYFGFRTDTEEFNTLIEGQEFRFTDNAFGTTYKLTKQGTEWIGDNLCYAIPEKLTKNDSQTDYVKIFVKWDTTNSRIYELCTTDYVDVVDTRNNPLKHLYDDNKFEFDMYSTPKYHKDGKSGEYWWIEFGDSDAGYDYSKNISVTINLNDPDSNFSSKIVCTWEFRSINLCNIYHAKLNQVERIKFDCSSKVVNVLDWYPNGLYLFMQKTMVFPLTDDLGYESDTNPFAFLADKCCYTITPRPEACSTLETTYNIRTSGVVIGQNIESHVFALNSIGNTVDRTVNRIEDIQKVCQELQNQITQMQNKTDWLTVIKDTVQIAAGLVSIVNGIRAFSSFAVGGVGGLAANTLSIGKQAEEIAEEEVIDEIIRDVDFLAPGIIRKDLELLQGPTETTINNIDTIVTIYRLTYFGRNYKLSLTTAAENEDGDDIEELIDYDFENQCFNNPAATNVQLIYKKEEGLLLIVGKHYAKVQVAYIKQSHGLGATSIGTELTNNKLLTAAAVKKLIDNNMKAIDARLTKLESHNQLQANQQLETKLVVLEKRCKNIVTDAESEEELTQEQRVALLEDQCKNILQDSYDETGELTLEMRLAIIDKKTANIL